MPCTRDHDAEAGHVAAFQRNASELNRALILLDNTLADPEAEPCSFRLLRAEKRLEDPLGVFRLDAMPGVADRDTKVGMQAFAMIDPFCDSYTQSSTNWHCLDCIADQVKKYLLQFDGETADHALSSILLIHRDAAELESAGLQFKQVFEEFDDRHLDRILRFTIETKRLLRNVAGAHELFFTEPRIVLCFVVERGMIAEQEEGVGDGLEGIVDLVRDDSRHPAHCGETFGAAQSLLGVKLGGDIAIDFEDCLGANLEGLAAGYGDLISIPGLLHKISVPTAEVQQR